LQIAMHMIDGINGESAKGMTGNKMDFGKIFASASQRHAKSGLEKAEGLGLKTLGFGSEHVETDGYQMWVDDLPGDHRLAGWPAPRQRLARRAQRFQLIQLNVGLPRFGAGSIFGGGHALATTWLRACRSTLARWARERFVRPRPPSFPKVRSAAATSGISTHVAPIPLSTARTSKTRSRPRTRPRQPTPGASSPTCSAAYRLFLTPTP
jgi:hypothetical protein